MSDLNHLFDNELDCIAVDNFLSAGQVSQFLKALELLPEWQEAKADTVHVGLFSGLPKPAQLFSSQYMVTTLGMSEDQYLDQCKEYQAIWNRLRESCGFDPFQLLVEYIKNIFDVTDVECASKIQASYSPIVIRDLSVEVLPHADFGPFDGPDWVIDQVIKQIAWNIYLTHPGEGGETIVYDYQWENDVAVDEGSYGIADLDKPIRVKFSVEPGKLVLFNSRNFHAVNKSTAPRIAIGGLLGLTRDGKIIAWS